MFVGNVVDYSRAEAAETGGETWADVAETEMTEEQEGQEAVRAMTGVAASDFIQVRDIGDVRGDRGDRGQHGVVEMMSQIVDQQRRLLDVLIHRT